MTIPKRMGYRYGQNLSVSVTMPGMVDRDALSKYAALLGRRGGVSKSKAKAAAARENGKLGGRPPKKGMRRGK